MPEKVVYDRYDELEEIHEYELFAGWVYIKEKDYVKGVKETIFEKETGEIISENPEQSQLEKVAQPFIDLANEEFHEHSYWDS